MITSSFTHLLEENFRWPAIDDKLFINSRPTGLFLATIPGSGSIT